MTPFEKAYAAARRAWEQGRGGPTFSFNGKPYSVATREEAARQKEMAQSPMRGRSYGGRAEVPASTPSPAPRPRVSLSDIPGLIARGMVEGIDRVPPGRGQGQMFVAAGAGKAAQAAAKAAVKAAQASRAAAPAAKRIEPLMYTARGQGGKFVPGGSPPGGKTPMATSRKEPTLGTGKVGRSLPKGKYEPMEYTARAPGGKFRKSEGK